MKIKYLMIALLLTGCASTPRERKQHNVLDCVKDMIQNDAITSDAFEVCRQVYGLKKIKE